MKVGVIPVHHGLADELGRIPGAEKGRRGRVQVGEPAAGLDEDGLGGVFDQHPEIEIAGSLRCIGLEKQAHLVARHEKEQEARRQDERPAFDRLRPGQRLDIRRGRRDEHVRKEDPRRRDQGVDAGDLRCREGRGAVRSHRVSFGLVSDRYAAAYHGRVGNSPPSRAGRAEMRVDRPPRPVVRCGLPSRRFRPNPEP